LNVRRACTSLVLIAIAFSHAAHAEEARSAREAMEGDGPDFGLGLVGGAALPSCLYCTGTLDGHLAAGAFAFYYPTRRLGIGLAADVVRTTWTGEPWQGRIGPVQRATSDLTSALVGVSARFLPIEPTVANLYFQLTLGAAFQLESGNSRNSCEGPLPGTELAVGAEGPIASWVRWDASLVAATAVKTGDCMVYDGPPPTPLVTPGAGVRVGVAFGKRQ
jgi:hypothetical protein